MMSRAKYKIIIGIVSVVIRSYHHHSIDHDHNCCDNDDCSSWRMGNQAEFEFLRENSCCSIFPRLVPSLHYHRNHQDHHNNSDPQPERRLSGGVEPQPSAENLGRDQPANKHGEDGMMVILLVIVVVMLVKTAW